MTEILLKALTDCCRKSGVRSVAMSAIATGYGKMDFVTFLRVASSVMAEERIQSLERVVLAIEDPFAFELARRQVEEEGLNFTFSLC